VRRKILVVLLVIALIAVVGALVVAANLGRIVKVGVEKGGTAALEVQTTLESASVSLLGGSLALNGLNLGSPEGFEESMFSVDHTHVDVDMGSLRSDTIIVNEVVIDGASITLEFAGAHTNWGKLMEGLGGAEEAETDEPPPADDAEAGRKLVISRILFTNGRVTVAGIPIAGQASVPLPRVELTDIGRDDGGTAQPTSVRRALRESIGSLYVAVVDAAGSILPAEQLKAVAQEAAGVLGDAGAAAVAGAAKAAGAAGAAAKGAARTAGDTAGGLGESAAGAAEAAGDAARGAAGKAKGVLTGVLGGDDD
jgi:uncharacterized protein involved in outer membrane biogenesis